MNAKSDERFRSNAGLRALSVTVLLCALAAGGPDARGQIVFDTASAWTTMDNILGSFGQFPAASTVGETIIAPDAAGLTLNSFTFYAQSHSAGGAIANLDLQAFVYAWSGNVTGTGGGAVGTPLYLSSPFTYSPPPAWTPLTVTFGGQGISLNAGQPYVIGVTLSNPTCYAASSGAIEFQELGTYQIPTGMPTGGGEAVFDNNTNNFTALNTKAWTTWGDTGVLSFTADITTIPEPPITALALLGVLVLPVKFRAKTTKFAKQIL